MNLSHGPEFGLSSSREPCPGASLLPPRKRLLAGLKQHGWVSPSLPAPPPSMQEAAELPLPPPAAQFAQHPTLHDPDRDCLGDSVEETLVQVERNADEDVNADRSESGSKRQKSSSPAANSRGPVKKLSQTTSESHNHGESKLRRKFKGSKAQPSSNLQSTTANLKKGRVSHREMAAAAKLTAVVAAKTAAEAKAIAADKAAAAAKAAAVAKAALEAVAITACDDTQKRRRKLSRRHRETAISGDKEENREVEVKQAIKFIRVSQISAPVDDEELARQLHRAMNSSPRISRSLTPCNRSKEDGTSLSSSQRQFQCKRDNGKRRAFSMRDVEKPEIKTFCQSFESPKRNCGEAGVQVESMNTMNETLPVNNSSQLPGNSENNFSDDITSDSVASQGRAEAMVRLQKSDGEHLKRKNEKEPTRKHGNEDPGLLNGPQDCSITKSTSASKNESVHSNGQSFSNLNSKEWTVKASGMDVEQSVNQSASHVREKKGTGSRNANKERSRESCHLRGSNEMHDMHSERNSEEAEKRSTISTETLLAVTSTVAENQEVKGEPNGDLEYDELLETGKPDVPVEDVGVGDVDFRGEDVANGLSSGAEIKEDKVAQTEEKDTCSDGRSLSMLKNLSFVESQTWHQEIFNGLPKGCSSEKATFVGGRSVTPFRSAPPVSLGTPTFASGSTASHS